MDSEPNPARQAAREFLRGASRGGHRRTIETTLWLALYGTAKLTPAEAIARVRAFVMGEPPDDPSGGSLGGGESGPFTVIHGGKSMSEFIANNPLEVALLLGLAFIWVRPLTSRDSEARA